MECLRATSMGVGSGKFQQSQKLNAICDNAIIIAFQSDPFLLPEECTSLCNAIFVREALKPLCMCLKITVLPKIFGPPCFPLCLILCSSVCTWMIGCGWIAASWTLIPRWASDGELFFPLVFGRFGRIGIEFYFGMREPMITLNLLSCLKQWNLLMLALMRSRQLLPEAFKLDGAEQTFIELA